MQKIHFVKQLIVLTIICLVMTSTADARKRNKRPPVRFLPLSNEILDVSVELKSKDTGREFEGWGVLSAGATSVFLRDYPEPYRSDILDYLFKPKYGLCIQHLKVEIGSGMDSTCRSEPSHVITPEELKNPVPRGYEFWLAAEARKRNPDIMLGALPWGTPYWTKGYKTKEAADWVVTFLDVAKKHYGLDFQYVGGIRNETLSIKAGAFEASFDFIKNHLRPSLDKAGYNDVKIQVADWYLGKDSWPVIDKVMSDPELMKIIDVVGFHYPVGHRETIRTEKVSIPEKYLATGKRVWASEDYSIRGGSFYAGHNYLGKMIRQYAELRMTKSIAWAPFTSMPRGFMWDDVGFLDASNCWNGFYKPFPAMWCQAHLTQFVDPGWKYMDSAIKSTGYRQECQYMVLKAPDGKDWSLIAVTGAKKAALTVTIDKDMNGDEIFVWKSDTNEQMIQLESIKPEGNVFKLTLDGNSIYSLTTTTGQQKPAPPNAVPSEVPGGPWKDDLKSYKVHDKVKYWGDYEGTFEIAEFEGQNVIRQMVPHVGVRWHKGPHGGCIALYGGCDQGARFKIKAEVRIQGGYAAIGGRNTNNGQVKLSLDRNGNWSLGGSGLGQSGKIENFDPDKWHSLELDFGRSPARCLVDGEVVFEGSVRATGLTIALMSSYHHNMFRNLEVVPAR